ncbi:hypothetical protein AGOR_G00187080 [Albula goreensis]|uniref:Butyrophilin subfamily 1 member A1-like n=1 Tax=Albula goreensis TaxID=1534307 RepID=A0A8T3D1D1_9TELE|nr:hypothetical protein AGOR_G00187080 [Albula goreensis]
MKGDGSECLCLILLLLHQTPVSRPERFQVLGPDSPVVAVAGKDVVLPCYLKPNISAEDMSVEWTRTHSTDDLVHLYREKKIRNENQNPSYRGRTALFPEELKRGNVSLRLSRVRGSDDGEYKCFIQCPTWYDDALVHVRVRAVGTEPVISMEGHRGGGIGLLCESKGWHPVPELTWLDSEGHSLSAEDTETRRDSERFFTVRRRVTVQESNTNRFTCRVLQQQLKQEKQTEIHIPAEMFHNAQSWRVACVMLLTLAIFVLIGCAVLTYRHVKLLREKESISKEKEVENKCRRGEYENACKFAVDVTLDPDTAHPKLILSEDGKQVRHGDTPQDLPDTPKRVESVPSVLGKEGFSSGRFYYEVQVGEKTAWALGVAKESINRKKYTPPRPSNGYWILWLKNGNKYWAGASPSIPLPLREKPRTVGVYVDYERGQVSFYNVEARSHIYSFIGYTFTEKLYPYMNPSTNENDRNSAPLIISPVRLTEFSISV